MKTRLYILSAGITLLTLACRKTDEMHTATAVTDQTSSAVVSTEWKTVSGWQNVGSNASVQSQTINEPAITAEVVQSGLVLVYAKDGANVKALPFKQEAAGNTYLWYYQASEGKIDIIVDLSSKGKAIGQQSISYFVITPDQLKELSVKGFNYDALAKLSFDEAKARLR